MSRFACGASLNTDRCHCASATQRTPRQVDADHQAAVTRARRYWGQDPAPMTVVEVLMPSARTHAPGSTT